MYETMEVNVSLFFSTGWNQINKNNLNLNHSFGLLIKNLFKNVYKVSFSMETWPRGYGLKANVSLACSSVNFKLNRVKKQQDLKVYNKNVALN